MAIQSHGADRVQQAGSQGVVSLDKPSTWSVATQNQPSVASVGVVSSSARLGFYSQSSAFDYQVTVKFSGLLKTPDASRHSRRVEFLAAILHWVDESHLVSDQSDFSFDQLEQVKQILESELSQSQAWLSKTRGSDGQ